MKTYRQQAKKAYAQLEESIHDMFANAPVFIPYEVSLNGSLAYGTDIPTEKPDLDVFIKTPFPVKAMQLAQVYFHKGIVKRGDLLIWYLDSYLGFPVDLVFEHPDHPKTQTLKHTEYFAEHLSEEAKKDTITFKRMAKKFNLYGAEVGGITGIACTVLATQRDEKRQKLIKKTGRQYASVYDLGSIMSWLNKGFSEYYQDRIIDPVLEGRLLTTNIPVFKQERARFRFGGLYSFWDKKVKEWKNAGYRDTRITPTRVFNEEFRNTVKFKRKEVGTDREFQRVASAVKKARNMLMHTYKHWNPIITYDILVMSKKTWVGFNIIHDRLDPVLKQIPTEVMDAELKDKLESEGKLEIEDNEKERKYFYVHKRPTTLTTSKWFTARINDMLEGKRFPP